ncbi:MAG: hypothetical protein RLZZ603_1547, partial [Actinomycetota bacterium]
RRPSVLKDASSWKAVAADTLGNVLALAGVSGDFQRRTFDPWGNPLTRDAAGSLRAATLQERRADYDDLPLAWATQEVDPDTGLSHYHFREYSPSLGGWLTRDPIGLAGGYLNLRSYLGNRPADALDAWGEVGNYLTMDTWMKGEGKQACPSSDESLLSEFITELERELANELSLENLLKNVNPSLRIADGMVQSAREAYEASSAAYRASIEHKSSKKAAAYYAASYFVASFTGIRKLHGAISGETAIAGQDGELQQRNLSKFERTKYGLAGAVELATLFLALKSTVGSTTPMGVSETANYAQTSFRESFSKNGALKLSEVTGLPIRTIDDLAGALRAGTVKPSQIPVNIINNESGQLILNTRTAQALERAGIPRNQWNMVNQTGNATFEAMLKEQLERNQLGPSGTTLPPQK